MTQKAVTQSATIIATKTQKRPRRSVHKVVLSQANPEKVVNAPQNPLPTSTSRVKRLVRLRVCGSC